MTNEPFEILSFLIVEDDIGRLMSLAEAFTESRIYNQLIGLPTGHSALEYLGSGAQHAAKSAADVLLFSDTMPDMSWQELVRALRKNPFLEHLRLVLMTHRASQDIISDELGKTLDLILPRYIGSSELAASLYKIPGFWCSFVRPNPAHPAKPPARTFTA
ncbi:MAG: hypothetical protein ACP5I8_09975 [Phycisphaerae bacterium]